MELYSLQNGEDNPVCDQCGLILAFDFDHHRVSHQDLVHASFLHTEQRESPTYPCADPDGIQKADLIHAINNALLRAVNFEAGMRRKRRYQ